METGNNIVTMGQPTLYRAPFHNTLNPSRSYDIEASVTVEDGAVTQMEDGYVRPIVGADAEPDEAQPLACFNFYGRRGMLRVEFIKKNDPANVAVLEAINDFCKLCEEAVTGLAPTE